MSDMNTTANTNSNEQPKILGRIAELRQLAEMERNTLSQKREDLVKAHDDRVAAFEAELQAIDNEIAEFDSLFGAKATPAKGRKRKTATGPARVQSVAARSKGRKAHASASASVGTIKDEIKAAIKSGRTQTKGIVAYVVGRTKSPANSVRTRLFQMKQSKQLKVTGDRHHYIYSIPS